MSTDIFFTKHGRVLEAELISESATLSAELALANCIYTVHRSTLNSSCLLQLSSSFLVRSLRIGLG
jgi:hypothetical protein